MWVNVPIALVTALLAIVIVHESRAAGHPHFDIPGAALATVALSVAVRVVENHARNHGRREQERRCETHEAFTQRHCIEANTPEGATPLGYDPRQCPRVRSPSRVPRAAAGSPL